LYKNENLFQVRRLHPMAPDAVADHVRHQYRGPDHLLSCPLHLPDADHPCRKARVPAEQVSRAGTIDSLLRVFILLAGNNNNKTRHSRGRLGVVTVSRNDTGERGDHPKCHVTFLMKIQDRELSICEKWEMSCHTGYTGQYYKMSHRERV